MTSVVARSASRAWAVGALYFGTKPYIARLAHGTFALEKAPVFGQYLTMSGVALVGKDPVAVGTLGNVGRNARALILERVRGAWVRMDTSLTARFQETTLTGIAARSANDAWVVGSAQVRDRWRPLVLHWNGIRWAVIHVPWGTAAPTAVAVTRGGQVWAVGGLHQTYFVTHLVAGSWQQVVDLPEPAGGPILNLHAVAAPSKNDVLIGGQYLGLYNVTGPVIEHWDGSTWTILDTPAGEDGAGVLGIAAGPDHSVLAVGQQGFSSIVLSGSSAGGSLQEIWPSGVPNSDFLGATFVRGTDTAFIAGEDGKGARAYRNCSPP